MDDETQFSRPSQETVQRLPHNMGNTIGPLNSEGACTGKVEDYSRFAKHEGDAVCALNALNCDGGDAVAEEAAAILLRYLKATGADDVANAYYDASQRNVKREGTAK